MIMERRSSLELMLEKLQQMEDQPKDVPPALPTRPVMKGRLPRSRRNPQFTSQSQISDCEENGSTDMISSFEERMFLSKRTEEGGRNHVVSKQDSAEMNGMEAPEVVIKSTDETDEGHDCRNNMIAILGKVRNNEDGDELLLERMLVTRGHLQGCQTNCFCHELNSGAIALQSFIRGENARKAYMRNMTAIAIIQKHVKGHLRSRILDEQDQAVICLETRSQGWLAWKYFNSIDKKGKQLNENRTNLRNPEEMDFEMKDQVLVPYSVLVGLRRQVLKTESLLDKKKEENALLQLKIKQLDRRRERYEAKMKSMEKMWQDQLTSMQMSLSASQRSAASRNARGKLGKLLALPEAHDRGGDDASPGPRTRGTARLNSGSHFLDQQDGVLTNNGGIVIEVESGQVASNNKSAEDFQKLKLKFRRWKKDFKTRLMDAKTTMNKLGNSPTRKSQRKWWRNMKKEEPQSPSGVAL